MTDIVTGYPILDSKIQIVNKKDSKFGFYFEIDEFVYLKHNRVLSEYYHTLFYECSTEEKAELIVYFMDQLLFLFQNPEQNNANSIFHKFFKIKKPIKFKCSPYLTLTHHKKLLQCWFGAHGNVQNDNIESRVIRRMAFEVHGSREVIEEVCQIINRKHEIKTFPLKTGWMAWQNIANKDD
jgi:hypothetical protein